MNGGFVSCIFTTKPKSTFWAMVSVWEAEAPWLELSVQWLGSGHSSVSSSVAIWAQRFPFYAVSFALLACINLKAAGSDAPGWGLGPGEWRAFPTPCQITKLRLADTTRITFHVASSSDWTKTHLFSNSFPFTLVFGTNWKVQVEEELIRMRCQISLELAVCSRCLLPLSAVVSARTGWEQCEQ